MPHRDAPGPEPRRAVGTDFPRFQFQHAAGGEGFDHWALDISTSSTSLIATKMIEVGAFEAKTHLSKLLDAVENGDRVFITRHGKRIAELCPVKKNKKARFGCAKGPGFYIAPDFDAPLDDFKEYS
jgi:prevent-host-death family protein